MSDFYPRMNSQIKLYNDITVAGSDKDGLESAEESGTFSGPVASQRGRDKSWSREVILGAQE